MREGNKRQEDKEKKQSIKKNGGTDMKKENSN